ncbi:chitobiase/beta-hexosaminidase C-terminal domain-containing protein [Maribacter sp. BPC-D8]|uniref:chitobiase/beta-hexosaminidase C-terminal domain-containing protein n=1 Tax=Maribacter sp. BPC-D8 TaxID=3053613 RepID=UPI002B460453|nr:chitobiase/beta-hexosaminidase C-terminal domain-containing protein [Maribacter sp. BPC-D8]WRI28294.1 chitobiase/beta-hexosaminidase C-terminal domain-containing protein [Maribacter sp. BPC-D8]
MIQLGIQIGHLHPLFVHLPIGIIMMAFLLEVYSRFIAKKSFDEIIEFTLLVAGATAILSLGTGWLLGEESGYDVDSLFLHRWMAVSFTVTTVLLYFVKRSKITWLSKSYISLFLVVLGLISLTGHFGGNMTHGEDYLFLEEKEELVITNIQEAKVYAQIVQPIFDDKCVSCHNANKAKGGLVMNSPNELLKGGDNGGFLDTIAGQERSMFLERVHLPLENEDHMPPKGKVQLTDNEKILLEWWLENKNCFECKVNELPREGKLAAILTSLEQDTSALAVLAKDAVEIPKEWLQNIRGAGIPVQTLSGKNHLLAVNMSSMDSITEDMLEALEEYAPNIVEMDFGFSNFSDELMSQLKPFKNLLKLKLQHTNVTDAIADDLSDFELLESLNLYGTAVTDKLVLELKKNKKLQSIYLWNTSVSTDGLTQLQTNNPGLTIQQIGADVFEATILDPPTIISDVSFFSDHLTISIESLFEGTEIYYTIDGSTPTEASLKYDAEITLQTTANVKAIAVKKEWKPSVIAERTFIKNNIAYNNVNLLTIPNEKYAGQKGKTLIDQKRGSTNFVDGNWLGFEGKHLNAIVELKEQNKISKVSIGALSAPASWIFYPKTLVVSASKDGVNYKEIGRKELGEEEPNAEVKLTFFDLEVAPTNAKYVKLQIQSPLKNPAWHTDPGGKSWIFIDEVVLN